ncbi:LuxR C-terminal-related transcriptional regulator [Actinoplanes sp. NEAU-A12]|uniref:LuxR C-terminal-related transcriptional regulator n=1 Tax=Actinoplanes sandaracinus TaxID=3045177 RepID=A0ABT6X156_9ACTN|nr:LuxR C-terminal-related transcriptional regulator [Actinoplanes sandaracinus]MDI6105746.1 LuxR C-terminal-related transcriptional regulator [Actinoplanes sandaracinus]
MNSPTNADLRRLLDLSTAFHDCAPEQPGELPAPLLAGMGALLGGEAASWVRVDQVEARLLHSTTVPSESNLIGVPSFHQVFTQHPGFAAFRDGRLRPREPLSWSDVISSRELRRLPLYADFFHARGTRDQLLCIVQLNRRHGTLLAFNRSRRGFTDRDRTVARLLAAQLAPTLRYRAEIARLHGALHAAGRHTDRLQQAAGRLRLLTPRERQVVTHLVAGLSDRDIARRLSVSERTVHKHLEQVYRKLGVHARTQVMAMLG